MPKNFGGLCFKLGLVGSKGESDNNCEPGCLRIRQQGLKKEQLNIGPDGQAISENQAANRRVILKVSE